MNEYRCWDLNVGSALRVPGGNPVNGLPPPRQFEEYYWCIGETRPKGIAALYDLNFFGHKTPNQHVTHVK